MIRKLGLAAALVALLLVSCAAFAQRSHRDGDRGRSFSSGGHVSGRHFDGGGYYRGGRGRFYGRSPRFSFDFGFYAPPRYYYRAPYAYGYYPPPCRPAGYYDWEGYWHYYPGCAVAVYPPPPYYPY